MKSQQKRRRQADVCIRQAQPTEAGVIRQLHTDSVRQLCGDVYTSAQIEAWVSFSDEEAYRQRLIKHRCFVAEMDGRIVGYARYNPPTQEFCSLYVDPGYTRLGIGSRLARTVFADARASGLRSLWLDASLNAVPVYETLRFKLEQFMVHSFAGVELECARMTRQLFPEEQ